MLGAGVFVQVWRRFVCVFVRRPSGLARAGTLFQLRFLSGTEKVPQRSCVTKILPNFRVNFRLRFASKPLFCCIVPSNCSENSLALFIVLFLGFWGTFFALDS